jgi:hypothetical protein
VSPSSWYFTAFPTIVVAPMRHESSNRAVHPMVRQMPIACLSPKRKARRSCDNRIVVPTHDQVLLDRRETRALIRAPGRSSPCRGSAASRRHTALEHGSLTRRRDLVRRIKVHASRCHPIQHRIACIAGLDLVRGEVMKRRARQTLCHRLTQSGPDWMWTTAIPPPPPPPRFATTRSSSFASRARRMRRCAVLVVEAECSVH